MNSKRLRRAGAGTVLIAAALLVNALPASAAPGDGSAYAAKINVSGPLGIPTVNLGPLAASNTASPTSASLASISGDPLVTAGAITSSAMRDDATGQVNSQAAVAGANIGLGPLKITAGAIKATCTATQSGNTGTAELANVTVPGVTIPVNPGKNTTLTIAVPNPIPGLPAINVATLVLNEQITNPDGSLTVNAFHLTLLGGSAVGNLVGSGDIVLASATCGPAAPPIPLASGAGLWLSLGLIGLATIAAAVVIIRRRRAATTG